MGAIHRDLVRWTELRVDADWEEYGGSWARRAHDGNWYVVSFENTREAYRSYGIDTTRLFRYVCEVKYCALPDISGKHIACALEYAGLEDYIIRFDPDSSWRYQGRRASPRLLEIRLVDAATSYGIAAVLKTFESDNAPVGTRAAALRFAARLIRDEDALNACLDQQANGFGNTVRELARGQIGY